VLCCVREQLTGILGILLASCDSVYLTQDNCPAPEKIHNDISGVPTYYVLWKNVFIFLRSTGTGTARLNTMQLQYFDQRKFSDMFNKVKRICMSRGRKCIHCCNT
jgi:hypothetical protein